MTTLEQLMAEAGLAGPENELLKAQYLDALKKSRTPQPASMQTRDMTVAASPVANIASTLDQILGGRDSGALMQAMSANLKKQQDFRTAGAQAATQPGADPGKMQYMFSAGGEPGLSGVANADENRLLKQALLAQQNAARQKQIETTGGYKLQSTMLQEAGKDNRFMPFSSSGTPTSGVATTNRKDGTVTTRDPVLNPNRPAQIGKSPEDIKEIADMIERGERSPVLSRMYGATPAITAELGRRGFDAATAENEWQAMQKHLASTNSSQQLRMRQSIDFAFHSLDNIENIYKKWQSLGGAHGLKAFNKADLAISKNLPGEAGATAQALQASINDMIEALGNVYMGGNTPTDQAFKLAGENLKADWNPETFKAGLELARKNLTYRANAMKTAAPVGTSGENRYAAPAGSAAPVSDKATIRFQGKTMAIPRARLPEAIKDGAEEVK